MKRYRFEVSTYVEVEIDEEKFTPEVMQGFNGLIYELQDQKAHASDIAAQLVRQGREDSFRWFLEGYGDLETVGVSASVIDAEVEEVNW